MVTPYSDLSPITKNWYENNKDDLGVAWEVGDYNYDGVTDIKMYSEYGAQIIYGFK